VFTALASTSFVDQSHAYAFIFRSRNTKISLKFKSYSKKPGSYRCCLLSPKCSKTHLRASLIQKFFRGLYPGPPFKGVGRKRGEGMEREEKERNRIEGKGREWKERGEEGRGEERRKRGREGMDALRPGPPKFLG
jgi:hypothetical protein